jgi:peptide/nickel transport system substrate-binding protein
MTKSLCFAIIGLVLSTGVRAFSAPPTDTLTFGISAEFENLNPMIGSQAATNYMLYMAYRPLVVLSLEGRWVPMLIKDIPTLSNKLLKKKGSGIEATIELIDTAKWGDGIPVTCEDIEFAWQVGKNKNVSIPNREPYDNITSITWDKATPKKCVIDSSVNKYDFYQNLPNPLPAHLEAPILKKYGVKSEGYDLNSLYTKNPSNPGLYNGPYVISEVKLGSHIIFTPNPHFYGKKPYFKKIIFKLIPNNATLEANLRSGIIDMICPAAGLGLDQAVIFEKKVKAENLPYTVLFEDGEIYAHIDLNLNNPILADLKVRKALSMGFNRKEMINSLMEGKGKEAIHFVTEQDPWYTSKVATYPPSKREAAKLLDEAGWKMGARGYREKGGKTLSLTLIAASGAKLNEMIEAYLQEKYKALGIELNIKNEPARVFFGETVTHRKFDMAMYAWMSIPEMSPRSTLHSTSIPNEKNSWAGQNYPGYKNVEVDKAIDALELELDAKKRIPLAHKILEAYARDIPVIPIYYRPNNVVIPKGLKGYKLSGHIYYESLYVENWSM